MTSSGRLLREGANSLGFPVVADRDPGGRRVSGHRLGDQRDAAADGDFLPAVHAAGGFRLSAAGGVQSGPGVQASRRARQTGHDHDDGFWLQCRRRGRDAHHRQPARAADRDPHEQLLPVQRAVADADPGRVAVHRQPGAGAHCGTGLGRSGCRRGAAGSARRLRGFLGAFPHRAQRRGFLVQPGTAAVSAAAAAADALHLH